MALAPGYVRIRCDDPRVRLTCRLGPDPIKYTAGYGGWEVVDRPGQVGMTIWNGQEPRQLQLGLMMDGFAVDRPIGPQVNKLFRIARGDGESPPGVITLEGVPGGPEEWVIEDIDHGDPIRRLDGYAIRQAFTLTLREYVPPEFLNLRRRALAGDRGKVKIIKTKKGDTPAKVANRYGCKWHEIRTLNRMTVKTARQKLKTGIKLRVPVPRHKPQRRGGTRGADQRRHGEGRD